MQLLACTSSALLELLAAASALVAQGHVAGVVLITVQRRPARRHQVTIEARLADAPVDRVVGAAHPHRKVPAAADNRGVAPAG